jgi:hypothetical protein
MEGSGVLMDGRVLAGIDGGVVADVPSLGPEKVTGAAGLSYILRCPNGASATETWKIRA